MVTIDTVESLLQKLAGGSETTIWVLREFKKGDVTEAEIVYAGSDFDAFMAEEDVLNLEVVDFTIVHSYNHNNEEMFVLRIVVE